MMVARRMILRKVGGRECIEIRWWMVSKSKGVLRTGKEMDEDEDESEEVEEDINSLENDEWARY